jgi:endonuclease/exonuclease/phosphatase family metal-dependent hydrolase
VDCATLLGVKRGVVAFVTMVVVAAWCRRPPPPVAPQRVATFNIEEFPRSARQIDGAFALIGELDAHAVAVQEILEPEVFAAAARRRLGASWRFVSSPTMPPDRTPEVHVGVLFDERALALVATEVHDETRLGGRQKPTFEVRLRPRDGGSEVQLFVVHFKAGSDGREIRALQYDAHARTIDRARIAGARTVVLGDFNATEPADRDDLARLARETRLHWASEPLGCTAFWRRAEDCATSRLDHALSATRVLDVRVAGACAAGCETRAACPTYRDEISDHCPVIVDLP